MLQKFDIVAFRTPELDKLSLGVAKNDSNSEERKIELAELSPENPEDNKIWKISNESKEIEKKNILLKLTQVKFNNKNSDFVDFSIEITGYDIQQILMLNTIKKSKEDKEDMSEGGKGGKMLGRREPPVKGDKGALAEELAAYYEEFNFEEGGIGGKESPNTRLFRERQRKMLPSFLRTATTNLRFELPDMGEDEKKAPNALSFMGNTFKTDKQTVLKTLSQDLSLIFNEFEVKRLKYIDVCQSVLKDADAKYNGKLKNTLDMALANKKYVSVPSKEEMQKTIHYFAGIQDLLTESAESKDGIDTQGLLYLIISHIFSFSLRFFMSHKTSRLHLLKNKMFIDKFEEEGQSEIEKLSALLNSLKKFIETLKNLLDDGFQNDYLDLCSTIGRLIGYQSEGVIDKDATLNKPKKIKVKKFLAEFTFDLIKELMNCERSEAHIIDIFVSIIHSLNFNQNFALKGKQTFLGKRLNAYYNNRINHTNKKWNLFVDSCCQFIREKRMEDIRKLQKEYRKISMMTQRMLSIQTSIAKGILVGALRVVLDEQVKSSKDTVEFGEDMNNFLDSLLDSSEKLPILIYFIQGMSRIHGDIEELAKTHEIKALDTFIQKFMFESGLDQANNIKHFSKDYNEAIETKNRIFFLLSNNKKDDEVMNFLIEGLPKSDQEFDLGEELSNQVYKRYVIWLTLINEFFTSYLVDQEFPARDQLVKIFNDNKQKWIDGKDYSEAHLNFMGLILNNFGGDGVLSIKEGDKEDQLFFKMTVINFMAMTICMPHKLIGKGANDGDNWFYKRPQLAALPGEAEEKYLLIANVFYSLDSNWRSGQQFTRLYKCSCDYLYWIGDCGRAWVVGTCPSCKKKIGGTSHNLVNQDNKEITKEEFFDKMYGPLEAISGKKYKVRQLEGKYSQATEEKDDDEGKIVEEEKKEDGEGGEGKEEEAKKEDAPVETTEETEGAVVNETDQMMEEKPEEDTPKPKESYIPIRSLDKECHFKFVEFMSHCRYLLDWMTEPQACRDGMKTFMRLKTDNYEQYFFDVILSSYNRIKDEEFFDLSKEMYFRGMNILLIESIPEKIIYNMNSTIKRNHFEKESRNVFDVLKPDFSSKVTQRLEMKKEMDGNLNNSSRLVKNWVNRMASISDLREKNTDIKLISGMRMDKNIDIEKLKDYLNSRLKKEESEGGDEILAKRIKFLMNVIGLEPILRIFKKMLHAHIDICNYLQYVFDFRLTYKMACAISINDLVTEDPIEDDKDETDEEFVKKRRNIIERNKGDVLISTKFLKLKEAWDNIMKYREEFTDLFDFRFLCHATELPQEKIDEIFEPKTAKLIYFLPSEKYVESLFMTSSLQTLGNIQNKVIKDSRKQYFRANYCHPKMISVQKATKNQIISMSNSFENVIKKCSFANLRFNKDAEMVYNIDMMEREVAIDLFFGSKFLSFEEKYIQNFNFSREFAEVANYVTAVSNKFGQTFLDGADKDKLALCCDTDIEETYAVFSRKLKELNEKQFNLSLMKNIKDEKDQFFINFECEFINNDDNNNGEKNESKSDENEKVVVELLNETKISLNNVKFVYEFIEEKMYEIGLKNLDPAYNIEIPEELKNSVSEQIKNLKTNDERMLVLKVAKGMTLRQLVGTTNENIGKTDLAMALEYSGILGDDEELNDDFLKGLSKELKMHHLVSFVSLFG